jgi:hypothetical protein
MPAAAVSGADNNQTQHPGYGSPTKPAPFTRSSHPPTTTRVLRRPVQ